MHLTLAREVASPHFERQIMLHRFLMIHAKRDVMASDGFDVAHLTYSYRLGSPPVIADFSLSVGRGSIVGIMGRSGVGKSTVLRLLKGLLVPSSGSVSQAGSLRNIVMLSQSSMALPWLRMRDNILLGARLAGLHVDPHDFSVVIDILELNDLLEKHPTEISGGQLRRALLARAVLHPHDALLLDEPLAGLDAVARVEISGKLRSFLKQKCSTCVFVAHDIDQALILADEVLVLSGKPARAAFYSEVVRTKESDQDHGTIVTTAAGQDGFRSAIWEALQQWN